MNVKTKKPWKRLWQKWKGHWSRHETQGISAHLELWPYSILTLFVIFYIIVSANTLLELIFLPEILSGGVPAEKVRNLLLVLISLAVAPILVRLLWNADKPSLHPLFRLVIWLSVIFIGLAVFSTWIAGSTLWEFIILAWNSMRSTDYQQQHYLLLGAAALFGALYLIWRPWIAPQKQLQPILRLIVWLAAIAILLLAAYTWVASEAFAELVRFIENLIEDSTAEKLRNLLFGLVTLIIAPFLIWRTWIADKQLDISRDRHYTNLFTEGAKDLGATDEKGEPDRATRIGAIYALERVARDSQRNHWAIMETLTAFIRENAPLNEGSTADEPVATDVQAALMVIGRRPEENIQYEKENKYRLDLRKTQIPGANFYKANLTGADFQEANLENANFQEANLEGANFRGARLGGANFLLAHLTYADFLEAQLEDSDFLLTHLENATFLSADLKNACFSRAEMEGTDFWQAEMVGAQITGADFSNVKNLAQKQIDQAFGDATTRLPPGLSAPEKWPRS